MRSWADYVEKILYVLIPASFLAAVAYMVVFIASGRAPLIPHSEVQIIKNWTYTDQMTGPEDVTTPVRVDTEGRDVFVFESKLPENLPEGAVIAFLNRVNLRVEVNGSIIKEWNRDEAPIIGGPAKNSYFIIPLDRKDAGGDIRVIIEDQNFGGKFFNAFVGQTYEVVRTLEIKSGAFQFMMSLALLIMSFAIAVAGLILWFLHGERLPLILMSLGMFVASSWMVVDSFVFQFVFRTQFIDGFMSYITTLCIVFPFIAYLDAVQEGRYKKWYVIAAALGLLNLYSFTLLHLTRTVSFSKTLLCLDLVIGVVILICMGTTITDIRRGNAKKYKYVAYGFMVFMILAIIELILINTVVERVEGGVIIAGLYILFAFAIVQQLVEIRRVQVERDRANEESITKIKFLTAMSHEIRTPINSILGMNEMILKESRDPNVLNYAGIIGDSGTMLLSLINDILDFSKIGSDMEEIVPVNYDPGKLFDQTAELLQSQARKKGLSVKLGKPRNLPSQLYGDEKRIFQIVVNLLTNAVKYTDDGTITFSGECFEKDGKYILCFYVSDTGIGIREEDIEGIFDPFHRLDLRKNQNIQGTGLGLSIVKNLVDNMNGEINVESVYGKGSTFSVKLPQEPKAEHPDEKYNSGNAVEDENLDDIDENYIAPEALILEVDDNLSNQIVVKEFLKEAGVKLDIASDGKEALRLCRVNKYDVILMDHMMPGMDGIETMHAIRTDEGSLNVDTPEVVLTANAIMGSRAQYEEEGFDNYLSKPVESARLRKMIRKYLPPEKVLYKPKKRVTRQSQETLTDPAGKGADTAPEAESIHERPIDFPALFARFDNREETVNMILEEIVKEGNRKIPLLKELADSEDIKRYAIEAHGVKGVMASSCVPSLSATAKSHELAAKEGNMQYVKDNVDSFIGEYRGVLDYIRDYLKGHGITIDEQ